MATKAPSSSELMERFAKAPTSTKVGVFVGIGAVLGLGYWYFFYSDLQEQLAGQKSQAKRYATEEIKLKDRKKEYRQLVDEKKSIEGQLANNQISLPASSELPSFFVSLQAQAIAANVQLVKWDRDDEVPVETYVKVPVSMNVRGDFYQILEYFKLLYETRRIITVENLYIGDGLREGDRFLLTAKFTASTFRQADLPPAVKKDDSKDAKDGKDAKGAKGAKDDKAKPGDKADAKAGEKGK
jgi:Tfp pilus assembly protein PilO